MLRHEILESLPMTQKELAARTRMSYPRINELVHGKRGVTPDTALRLARLFGTTPEVWLNGQLGWDLWHAMRDPRVEAIGEIEPIGEGEGAWGGE